VLGGELAGDDQVNPGDHPGPRVVNRDDAGVSQGAAEQLAVEHSRQLEVVDVVALAYEQPPVFDAATACA
jgi:hypothetical protein